MKVLRVLIVDDSALNRQTLENVLQGIAGIEVVAKAADGDEALRLTVATQPDLITLDLEMPRMDGFTFLRLLMASRPTPVIVISSHSAKENVFRALELGAIDFITKPHESLAGDLSSLTAQLEHMIETVRQLTPANVQPSKRMSLRPGMTGSGSFRLEPRHSVEPRPPDKLVVVASSTGGPTALLEVFARLPGDASAALLVAQHMPERFTRTFAERLDRLSSFSVREAADVQLLYAGTGLVCPGGRSIEVARDGRGEVACKVVFPDSSDRYAPSADRLFSSAAEVAGDKVVAVVLTGMGDDGAIGVAAVKKAGGVVLAEAEETAVVYGMPRAVERTGLADQILPLRGLSERVVELIS